MVKGNKPTHIHTHTHTHKHTQTHTRTLTHSHTHTVKPRLSKFYYAEYWHILATELC